MSFQTFSNQFTKGWNQDIDPRFQDNSSYRNPKNISITSDGDFFSCKNLAGSSRVASISSVANTEVLGAFECVGRYGAEEDVSIVIFSKSGTSDNIHLYNCRTQAISLISSTLFGSPNALNLPSGGTVDAFVFGENGLDNIYWDDHQNRLRSMEVIDAPVSNPKIFTTQRYAPVDPISYVRQDNGNGQLASGTYSFAYRYFNTETKNKSLWSLYTNMAPVYPIGYEDVNSLDEIYGGVANEVTRKSIVLSIDKTPENSDIYNSIQLSVIKNISGLKTIGTNTFVTTPRIDWFDNPSEIVYEGGGLESAQDIGESTIDDACVESAKSLTVKDNVLFRGNINYADRVVESATFSSARTIKNQIGLSGGSYLPFVENTNNPSFDLGSESIASTTKTNDLGQTSQARIHRAINLDWCQNCNAQDLAIVGLNKDRVYGGKVFSGGLVREPSFSIPENIQPGNEINLRVVGFPEAIAWKSSSKQLFRHDYLLSSIVPTTPPGYLSAATPDAIVMENVLDFKYIVGQGETAEQVAENIVNRIVGNPGVAGKVDIEYLGGRQAKIESGYPVVLRNFPGNATSGIVDVEYWIQNGVDTSISGGEEDLDELTSNPSSKKGGYKNPLNTVASKGYFRDEVMRYGIVWQDAFGCWSNAVPLDFSALRASEKTTEIEVTSLDSTYRPGLARITTFPSPTVVAGDYLVVSNASGQEAPLVVSQTLADNSILVNWSLEELNNNQQFSDDFESGNVMAFNTLGGQFSHSKTGSDWKFPKRSNSKFPIISAVDDSTGQEVDLGKGFIQPIGLRIEGITNPPPWAVAFAIVRVRRDRDILAQTPVINSVVAMPSVFPLSENKSPFAGGLPEGSFGPKTFSKGISRNIERTSSDAIAEQRSFTSTQKATENNVPPVAAIVPPEYMMSQEGQNFDSAITPALADMEIIDAVTVYRTPGFDVDGSGIDDGDNIGDQLAFGLRADTPYSYYHRGDGEGLYRLNLSADIYEDGLVPVCGKCRILEFGEVVTSGAQYTFSTQPLSRNFALKRVDRYGMEPTSLQDCSNPVPVQKSIVVSLSDDFGDISWYGKRASVIGAPRADLDFSSGDFKNEKMNLGEGSYRGEIGSYRNVVTPLGDGPSSIIPVANIRRGLSDDRYGDVTDVHPYIFTGTYVRLDGSDSYDVDVWGGDCFISKFNVKTSQSVVDTRNNIFSGDERYGVYSYFDFQEVVSLYMESRVNTDLQASPFVYPVKDSQTLSEFRTAYTYPYNFSYSIDNEAKTWVSRSITDVNRNTFPSRIIFSDQKVFQTDQEGFDRFRAASFFDLPEDYEDITKLVKLANDQVYVIQESGVCVLPINKNVIEDTAGEQLIVNSSTLINRPQYLMNQNGSQHIRSVSVSETHIYFMDARKREVFKVAGGQDSKISDIGLYSEFREKLGYNSGIPDASVVSGYDFNDNEYWIGVNGSANSEYENGGVTFSETRTSFLNVWSDKMNAWRTAIEPSFSTQILYSVYSRSDKYIIGEISSGSLVLEEMYTGDVVGTILGEIVESSVELIVNPEEPYGKTFDVLRVDADNRVDLVEMSVLKEDGTMSQETAMNARVNPRHDGYEIPVLRDQSGGRMRGKYAVVRMTVNNQTNVRVKISSLLTKFRLSARIFR